MTFLEQYGSHALLGMIAAGLIGTGWVLSKRRKLGKPLLIPAFFYQFTGLVLLLVLGAEIIAAITGFTWQSPFTR